MSSALHFAAARDGDGRERNRRRERERIAVKVENEVFIADIEATC